MSRFIDVVRRVVQQELAGNRTSLLGVVTETFPHEAEDDSNVLNVYVNYLRNKIEAGRYPRIIQTLHGVGYMLAVDGG